MCGLYFAFFAHIVNSGACCVWCAFIIAFQQIEKNSHFAFQCQGIKCNDSSVNLVPRGLLACTRGQEGYRHDQCDRFGIIYQEGFKCQHVYTRGLKALLV